MSSSSTLTKADKADSKSEAAVPEVPFIMEANAKQLLQQIDEQIKSLDVAIQGIILEQRGWVWNDQRLGLLKDLYARSFQPLLQGKPLTCDEINKIKEEILNEFRQHAKDRKDDVEIIEVVFELLKALSLLKKFLIDNLTGDVELKDEASSQLKEIRELRKILKEKFAEIDNVRNVEEGQRALTKIANLIFYQSNFIESARAVSNLIVEQKTIVNHFESTLKKRKELYDQAEKDLNARSLGLYKKLELLEEKQTELELKLKALANETDSKVIESELKAIRRQMPDLKNSEVQDLSNAIAAKLSEILKWELSDDKFESKNQDISEKHATAYKKCVEELEKEIMQLRDMEKSIEIFQSYYPRVLKFLNEYFLLLIKAYEEKFQKIEKLVSNRPYVGLIGYRHTPEAWLKLGTAVKDLKKFFDEALVQKTAVTNSKEEIDLFLGVHKLQTLLLLYKEQLPNSGFNLDIRENGQVEIHSKVFDDQHQEYKKSDAIKKKLKSLYHEEYEKYLAVFKETKELYKNKFLKFLDPGHYAVKSQIKRAALLEKEKELRRLIQQLETKLAVVHSNGHFGASNRTTAAAQQQVSQNLAAVVAASPTKKG